MSKITKIYISETGDIAARLVSLKEADEQDLRILSAILMLDSRGEGVSLSYLEELLEIPSAQLFASVKYWKGAGVLSGTRKEKGEFVETLDGKTPAVATVVGVEEYSNEELANILEDRDRKGFIDAAQVAMGRMFNKNEINKLIGIADQLGFEEEAVLAILFYCKRMEKKSLSYAEKVAMSFHDEEIFSITDVHARIDKMERRNDAVEKIRGLFGCHGRALTTSEKKMFGAWVEDYGFDFEIIRMAYDITVDATHEPAPKYANAILKKWHENGLSTVSEIEAFVAEGKDKPKQNASRTARPVGEKPLTQQQIDAEEWFELRIKQTFGE